MLALMEGAQCCAWTPACLTSAPGDVVAPVSQLTCQQKAVGSAVPSLPSVESPGDWSRLFLTRSCDLPKSKAVLKVFVFSLGPLCLSGETADMDADMFDHPSGRGGVDTFHLVGTSLYTPYSVQDSLSHPASYPVMCQSWEEEKCYFIRVSKLLTQNTASVLRGTCRFLRDLLLPAV